MQPDKLALRVIELRTRKGFSPSQLAMAARVPLSSLLYIESGRRAGLRLSVETALRIARALGVGLDYLAWQYEPDQVVTAADRG